MNAILFITIFIVAIFIALAICAYIYYPRQSMPIGEEVMVTTPDFEKYHNDCLHPCIRQMDDGRYVMVQSPWYEYADGIENPILYISNDPMKWDKGIVVEDTPEKGYNSDPNVFVEGKRIYVFWREYGTDLCDQLGAKCAVVGVWTDDEGATFSKKRVYLTRAEEKIGTEICPILMKHGDTYRFYATWYQTWRADRHNLGIAIWKGASLEEPDFVLTDTIPIVTKNVCDKFRQYRIGGHLYFVPSPHKFDMWHFDLFEYNGMLCMVASEEMGDNICMAVSKDWNHFEVVRTPLQNAHSSENLCGYRQYYYKPTAYVKDDTLHLYYTANAKGNHLHNQLFHSSTHITDILK